MKQSFIRLLALLLCLSMLASMVYATQDADPTEPTEPTESTPAEPTNTANFDGYVEVSTTSRTTLWQSALKTWAKDPQTIIFGVGLGGALKGIYESGNFSSSREIL